MADTVAMQPHPPVQSKFSSQSLVNLVENGISKVLQFDPIMKMLFIQATNRYCWL